MSITIDEAIKEINEDTLLFFGELQGVYEFIELICKTSSIALSGSKMNLSAVELLRVVNADKSLMTAISLAKEYATEIAEGILYERAVYGYDEEVYDATEQKVKRVHKCSDRALIDYLRANDAKYRLKSGKASVSSTEPLRLELVNFE